MTEQIRTVVREEIKIALDSVIADIQNLRDEIHTVDERRREAVSAEIAHREAMQTELATVNNRAKANEAVISEIPASVQRLTDMQAESLAQIHAGIQSNHQVISELKAMQDIERQRDFTGVAIVIHPANVADTRVIVFVLQTVAN